MASPGSNRWKWVLVSILAAFLVLGAVVTVVLDRAAPILKGRIEETLSARTGSRVALDTLHVSILHGLVVSGDGLRIYPATGGSDQNQPLIAVDHFAFHSDIIGLFLKPMHVHRIQVSGLDFHIPPRNRRPQQQQKPKGKIKIVVDEILCEHSRLTIAASKAGADPKDFELQHIELHDFGPNRPWQYKAVLINAIPIGQIHSTGNFGPLDTNDPGSSPVDGHYTFDHADLGSIKGIGGILSSVGDFHGELDRITVDGTTDTPDFSLDTANHPTPLHTQFHAIVDGTNGNTYLQPVKARLEASDFTVRGEVVGVKGRGHLINLDVDIPGDRIQDFLDLAVKTQPPVMTGAVQMKAKLNINPGQESVTRKLQLSGRFTLTNIHFTNPAVEDKVDMLSLRARGKAKQAKPGAPDVRSQMTGQVVGAKGILRFSSLVYQLPGARVDLTGRYSLDGQEFDFRGDVFTKVSLRHLVASPWASLLLTPISPFFKAKDGGAKIPVSITGTRSAPKFGLNLFGH